MSATPLHKLAESWLQEARMMDENAEALSDAGKQHLACCQATAARVSEQRAAELKAALTDQWQPIKTAPLDGTCILVVSETHIKEGWPPQIVEWTNSGWFYTECYDEFTFDPTHWMPLPPPPTPKSHE